MARKKKKIDAITPESLAKDERKKTECARDTSPNKHNIRQIYSKSEFIKDYNSNDSRLADTPENRQREISYLTDRETRNIGDMLLDYSMQSDNISFSGFFRLYGMAPSVLFEQLNLNAELKEKYELARSNLSYNNEKKLGEKLTPQLAGKVAQFQSQFDAVRQRDRRAEKRFEERNKLKVMRKLIKERKELDESEIGGTKVSYEVVYDGQKVEV
jgi:hypothetical protein